MWFVNKLQPCILFLDVVIYMFASISILKKVIILVEGLYNILNKLILDVDYTTISCCCHPFTKKKLLWQYLIQPLPKIFK